MSEKELLEQCLVDCANILKNLIEVQDRCAEKQKVGIVKSIGVSKRILFDAMASVRFIIQNLDGVDETKN